jgi:Protein of unknown function (DUF3176)
MKNHYRPIQAHTTPNLSNHSSPILTDAISSYHTNNESCRDATLPKGSSVSTSQPCNKEDQSISTASPRRSTPSKTSHIFVGWLEESISWLFSVSCLGAIAIILRICEGRPVPQLRFGLTLNSTIALFSTLAKLALMNPVAGCISQLKCTWFAKTERNLFDLQLFDMASRGEWGGLMFLVRRKKKSVNSPFQAQ